VKSDSPNARFVHVTAVGSNSRSWFLYPKTKGEAEIGVSELLPQTVLRPGLLDRGDDTRTTERMIHFAAKLFPSQVISVADVAKCVRQIIFKPHDIPQDIKPAKVGNPSGGEFENSAIYEHAQLREMAAKSTV
jgi:uncharacterized protein YbjT (DUF2867 family)